MLKINKVSIDASSICQLRCPECSNSKGLISGGIIGSGFLSFENFKSFVADNPSIFEIELSNWGEIFLNPDLIKIIEHAHNHKIKLTAGNGVNFNTVNNKILDALVRYKFGYLNISIDGASQETYSQYRIGGNFQKVINNIKKLNLLKEKHKSEYPKLAWQFILFGHNEHEISTVKELCKELNMVFSPKLNHSDFSPIRYPEYVKVESGLSVSSRDEYKAKFNRSYKRPCCQLWCSPQINWDGKLLGCCVNKWVALGNVFDYGLTICLESKQFNELKLVLKGELNVNDKMPCFFCPTFQQIREQPITDDEILEYAKFIHPAEKQ